MCLVVHGYNFGVAGDNFEKLRSVVLERRFGSCSFVGDIGVWQSGLGAEH